MSETSIKTHPAYSHKNKDDFGHSFQLLVPESVADIALTIKQAKEDKGQIVPGAIRPIPAQSQAKTITFLDLSHLTSISELSKEDKVIKVETGITIDELNKTLAKDDLWFPVSAPKSKTTLLDVINNGNGGCLEHGFGGPKKLVLGVDVTLANGDAITCGGRVVKNVTGYDLPKLFVGANATLGIVTSAYLRLSAMPKSTKTLVFEFASANEAFTFANKIARHNLPISSLELISAKLAAKINLAVKVKASASVLAFVEIYGQSEQIQEVGKEISNLVPAKATALDYKSAQELWSNIGGIKDSHNLAFLEVKNKQSSLCEITDTLRSTLWQARPNCRRLTSFAKDEEEIAAIVQDLISKAENNKETFDIAYANKEFEYKVETVPKSDANLQSLRARIKERFDPDHIFNPLVSL